MLFRRESVAVTSVAGMFGCRRTRCGVFVMDGVAHLRAGNASICTARGFANGATLAPQVDDV